MLKALLKSNSASRPYSPMSRVRVQKFGQFRARRVQKETFDRECGCAVQRGAEAEDESKIDAPGCSERGAVQNEGS